MTSPTDHLTDTHTPSGSEVAGDAADAPGSVTGKRRRGGRRLLRVLPALVVLAVLAYLPYVPVELPGILPGRVNGPGSLQLLATCLVVGGIALSYDVVFGRTGLLSFGHALFVAAGSYLLTISLSTWALPLPVAVLAALGLSTVLALVVGAIALRVGGIAFAMVTLAFAQAASIIVMRNPGGVTGGEEGRPLDRDAVPDLLVGVANAPYRYWLALGFVVVAWVAVTRARAVAGRPRHGGRARERAARRRPRVRDLPRQAPGARGRLVARRRRRHRPRARARRVEPAPDHLGVHALPPRHGGARWRRQSLGRPHRRASSTRMPMPGSSRSATPPSSRACPTSCARCCPSRSSSSASSSSSWSTSLRQA